MIRQAEIVHYNKILYNHHNSGQMLWKYIGKSLNGIYPNAMKIAKILAILKKGSKVDPNNNRPISLLICVNKIFERLLHKHLRNFLKKHKLLFKCQFGFRSKHSTSDALNNITDNIKNLMDRGNYVLGLFLYSKKAFDTIDHQILLNKLKTME